MTDTGRPAHRVGVGSVAFWAAGAIPPVAIFLLIGSLAVNVPFQDDWDMLATVTKWHAGSLSFADFWQQHSEHRIVALKAMIWAVGAVTRFNVIAEMIVGLVIATIKLTLIIDLLRLSLKDHAPRLIAPLALCCSLLMFSLVQHETWFWGSASLQFSALNLCSVTVFWILFRWRDSWRGLAVAGVSATVAMFTGASGQLLWITGAAGIELLSTSRQGRLPRLLVWAAAGSAIQSIYFWRLHWAPSSLAAAIARPEWLVTYAGACLGLPFASWMTVEWSAVVACFGCVALLLGAWFLRRSDRTLFRNLYPFLLFAVQGVLVSILIALGRSGGDPQSALTSHYTFAPTLFWIAVLVVTSAACSTGWTALRHPARSIAAACIITLLTISFTLGNVAGYREAYTRSRNLRMALATLFSEAAPPRDVLRFLYPPDEERAFSLIAELHRYRLGPFADGFAEQKARLTEQFTAIPAGPDADGFHDGGDCNGTPGWAWDPAHPDRPVMVDVWVGDTRLGTATADWFRWDLLTRGTGNGQHAFRFRFPTQTGLRTGRVVTVTFAGTRNPLRGSPRTVACLD